MKLAPAAVGLLVIALIVAASGHWRIGIDLMGAALVLSGIARLMLPKATVTQLAVRSRIFDTLLMVGIGVTLLVLVSIVPTPS